MRERKQRGDIGQDIEAEAEAGTEAGPSQVWLHGAAAGRLQGGDGDAQGEEPADNHDGGSDRPGQAPSGGGRQSPGFVYLIGVLEGCHKIGFSTDPEGRAAKLSKPGFPLCVVHAVATRDMRWLERVLHAAFGHVRVGGEWFRLSATDIATVSELSEVSEPGDLPELLRGHADAQYARHEPAAFAIPPAMVRLSEEQWLQLKERAVAEDRTVSQVLRIVINFYFAINPVAVDPTRPVPALPPVAEVNS